MPAIAFADFRDRVLLLYAPTLGNSKSKSTHQKMRQVLSVVEGLGGVTSTADLTTELVARFVGQLPGNANTVRGQLGYLKAACRIALEEHWIDDLPRFHRVMPRELRMTRNPVLRYRQLQQLLTYQRDHARGFRSRRLYAATAFVSLTGVRRDEALHARLEDFDWTAPLFRVTPRPKAGKGLKTTAAARDVPVCPELRAILRQWLPWTRGPWLFPNAGRTGPWVAGSVADRPLGQLQASAKAAGLGRVTWHGLRHSFATISLRDWGRPIEWVSQVLGHTSIRTTQRYLHLDDAEYLCDGAEALTFKLVG